jgi:hypothetical protein
LKVNDWQRYAHDHGFGFFGKLCMPRRAQVRPDPHRGLYCWAIRTRDFGHYLSLIATMPSQQFAWVELGAGATPRALHRDDQYAYVTALTNRVPPLRAFEPLVHTWDLRRSPAFEIVVEGPTTLYPLPDNLPPGVPTYTYRALIDTVEARSPMRRSVLHGAAHGRSVAHIGLKLATATPGADAKVVFLFALFHDCLRQSHGRDPDHGQRAATLAAELHGVAYDLDASGRDQLLLALRDHDKGYTTDDPTVGCSWDADRLTLWRVGATPDPRYLSTAAGRERIDWARTQAEYGWLREWEPIYAPILGWA